MSSIQSQSHQTSGFCASEFTNSVDVHSNIQNKEIEDQAFNNFKKDIWSKKENDEVLTVLDKLSKKKIQSNRKQSTPVGNLEILNGGFSWKKNRKQSENIIFNSMDGWKKTHIDMDGIQMEDNLKLSKSTVFSINVGMKDDFQIPIDSNLLKPKGLFNSYIADDSIKKKTSLKPSSEKKNNYQKIFSNETKYTSNNFLENMKQIEVSDHIQNIKSKSSTDFTKKEDCDTNKIMTSSEFSILNNSKPKRKSVFGVQSETTPPPPKSIDQRKESDFTRYSVETQEYIPSNQFSLAKQNMNIQKQLEIESETKNRTESEDCLLSQLKLVKSQCQSFDSPKSKKTTKNSSARQDTPITSKCINSMTSSTQNLSDLQISSQINLQKSTATNFMSLSTKTHKSNHLKMRLKRKILLKKEKEKSRSTQRVTENLNNLIQRINQNESSTKNFSQMDINVMKTLSKSIHKSKLFLNTRSRYEFVDQDDALRPSDLVVSAQDLPGSHDRDVLSITNLIQEFLAPVQPGDSHARDPFTESKQNKVKISF